MTITILYLDQYCISYMYTHVCMWACWHVYYEGMSDADVALQGERLVGEVWGALFLYYSFLSLSLMYDTIVDLGMANL